ncbi:uncharacterized membrane protein C20F10.07-like isoform X4 [Lytechinus variegatus]|uniref:uncharacterized membrane protein C20F10.07-like isoform X4 n=1 Tax=Lytechinus variegatus TaxID=7654 RepID=UPI001BB194FC|nr:uncharacterized membrane protein C20F10.07-like isoform X4 [Lytechinus variegatus]
MEEERDGERVVMAENEDEIESTFIETNLDAPGRRRSSGGRNNNKIRKLSKSFGNSVSKAFNEAVSKLEMGHDSRNKQFHKLFPCVPDSESVINTYSCALVRDILLQGRMFVSENWICFHSNIFTYEKQIAIKVETITKITKEKTAFVVPNAIGLHTPSEKHIFGSLLSRHSTHQLLYRVWKNAKGETESMSPSSSLQGDSDEEDIPGESEDEDELDMEHDGPNGRVLPPVSVHEYQRLESSRFSVLCSVSIFKSIKRLGNSLKQLPQYQPFLLLIGILLLCLTFSAAVLSIRIWRLQPHMATPSQTSAHESVHLENMDNIGNLFLSEQHKHQEKVSHIQDTLSANLKTLLQVQSSLLHLNTKSSENSNPPHQSESSPDRGQKEDL